jgi:hypothetical protein
MTGHLSDAYLNRLRLLSGRDRFYKPGSSTLNSLARNGLIARTGRQDRFGREEWTATEEGRQAAAGAALKRSDVSPYQMIQPTSSPRS